MNIVASIVAIVIALMGFAGGGGSSSGGGGGGGSSSSSSSYSSYSGSGSDEDSDPIVFVATIIIFIVVMIFSAKGSKHPYGKDYNSTALEKKLHEDAKNIFESYQSDWTNFNYENLKTYTTARYCEHATLMLDLLKDLHRVNKVSELKVRQVLLKTPVPDDATFPLKVRVMFAFNGLDEVYDDRSHLNLYKNHATDVSETWNFIYDGQALRLDGISQPTESAPHLIKSLATFAEENHLFYSPDWGRYCLPARGLIFGGTTMHIADINNHIIGRWPLKNAENSALKSSATSVTAEASALKSSATSVIGGLLVQLYSYAPRPGEAVYHYYLVGQINVPKDYLGVIVKSKKFKTKEKPDKSYEKFELEWPDFNKRYEVFAAKRDALPAFELLNPKFMEFLYNKNPSYNLEVVDNVIYIYLSVKNATEKDYADLLEVLKAAHAELKM